MRIAVDVGGTFTDVIVLDKNMQTPRLEKVETTSHDSAIGYTHRWRTHDLVMWDNRCCLHRGTEYDELRWKRDMHRATVSDIATTCEQEHIEVTAAAAV